MANLQLSELSSASSSSSSFSSENNLTNNTNNNSSRNVDNTTNSNSSHMDKANTSSSVLSPNPSTCLNSKTYLIKSSRDDDLENEKSRFNQGVCEFIFLFFKKIYKLTNFM